MRFPDTKFLREFVEAHSAQIAFVAFMFFRSNTMHRACIFHVIDVHEWPWIPIDIAESIELLLVPGPAAVDERTVTFGPSGWNRSNSLQYVTPNHYRAAPDKPLSEHLGALHRNYVLWVRDALAFPTEMKTR
jgi:hypothetical protein